ncbi:Ig-like domain-containing protein [Methanobacterium sp.]|uniref:Ig-like domain-containing protein n=1 Tax=Methanobacterium sp. TaxID=2164 RepID=UPI003C71B781
MKNLRGFLLFISVLAIFGMFMGSVSAASLNLTDAELASSGVKNYTTSTGHLPGYVDVSDKNVSTSSFLNIITTYTVELNKSVKTPVTIINVAKPSSPSGTAKGTLTKSEYVTIANNIKNYINTHQTAPNYASSSIGNIRYESLVYIYSKIMDYYLTYNSLPNTVLVSDINGVDSKGVIINNNKPPLVSSTSPTNNAAGVSLTSPITIKFSENIIAGVNYSKIYVKNLNTNNIVPITKTISLNTLTIKQSLNRLINDNYQVYIPSGSLKDGYGNNLATAYTFKFSTSPSTQDLTVTNVVAPITGTKGATIIVQNTVKNLGNTATKGFWVAYYITTSTTSTNIYIGERYISSLAAGAINQQNTQLTIPTNISSGNYLIKVKADSTSLIKESNENNNIMYSPGKINIINLTTTYRPVYITSDNINNTSEDNTRINNIVAALQKLGLFAVNYGLGPGDHFTILQNVTIPQNALIVDIYGGFCAGTIWEMNQSYYNYFKGNRTVFTIWIDTPITLDDIQFLPRA